jgi:hypothetical protein
MYKAMTMNRKILAYADDLVLLSNNQEDMQKRLDETELLAGRISIKINPTKSFSMHLSGVTPVSTRDTTFHIQNQPIRILRDGEIDRFLETAHLQKGDWTKLDDYIRASIKRLLNVPQEASNDYIYMDLPSKDVQVYHKEPQNMTTN